MDEIYRFKVGDFECITLLDSDCAICQASSLYPNAPAAELAQEFWAYHIDPEHFDEKVLVLAVNTGEGWLLVDAGYGSARGKNGQFWNRLASLGLKPEDIDVAVITHLHSDHYGGLTDANGQIRFPNAKVYLWEDEWSYWTSEATMSAIEAQSAEYAVLLRKHLFPLQTQVILLTQDTDILPGIRVIQAPAHTPYHVAVWIESAGECLLCGGDAFIPPVSITRPEWKFIGEFDQTTALSTRQRLLQMAAERNALVYGPHFVPPGIGRLQAEGNRWRWQPV